MVRLLIQKKALGLMLCLGLTLAVGCKSEKYFQNVDIHRDGLMGLQELDDTHSRSADIYKFYYEYGKLIKVEHLKNGVLYNSIFGWSLLLIKKEKDVLSLKFFDPLKRPTNTSDGYHEMRMLRKSETVAEVSFHDQHRLPIRENNRRVYKHKLLFNKEGQIKEIQCLDRMGKKVLNYSKFNATRFKRNKKGETTEVSYWNLKGEAVNDFNKEYHRELKKLDQAGFAVESRYFDKAGKAVANKVDGCFIKARKYSKTTLLEVACLDKDNKPMAQTGYSNAGVSFERQKHGKRQELTELTFFDKDNKPFDLSGLGFHRKTENYNAKGFLKERAFYDSKGKAVIVGGWGYHRTTHKYNAAYKLLETRYFGPGGEAVISTREGVHALIYSYDKTGNLTEMSFLDVKNKPAASTESEVKGCFTYRRKYNVMGNVVSGACFGKDNKPILRESVSWHRQVSMYTKDGRIKGYAIFGVDGKPVLDKQGCHRWDWKSNPMGKIVESRCMGTDGKPAEIKKRKYHLTKSKYNEFQDQIQMLHFDKKEKPLAVFGKIHGVRLAYDTEGRNTEVAFLGTDLKPVSRKGDDVHSIKESFYPGGRKKGKIYYDTKGNRTNGDYGYGYKAAELQYEYHDSGKLKKITYLSVKGKVVNTFKY